MEKLKYLERLNQLEKATLLKDKIKRNCIFITAPLIIWCVVLDLLGGWLCNWVFPTNDSAYWEAYFLTLSFKTLLISIVARIISLKFFKDWFVNWLTASWLGFCFSDLIDVIGGNRSEFTTFDVLAIVFCLLSLSQNLLNYYSHKKTNH